MSANNFILIEWNVRKKEFEATERDAESGLRFGEPIAHGSLSDTAKQSEQYIRENGVEYGIRFDI